MNELLVMMAQHLGEDVLAAGTRMTLVEVYSNGNVGCIPLGCVDYHMGLKEFHAEAVEFIPPVEPAIAQDGYPLDYVDSEGLWRVMCACGHRVGGSQRPGDKIALCPNCLFTAQFVGGSFPVIYPSRVPDNGHNTQEGDHPDHLKWRAEKAARDLKNKKAKERRLAKRGIK